MADSIITKQALIDAQKDAQALEEVINGEPGKLIKTRLGRMVYTLASVPQINTMTREEVALALTPKADKTYVDSALTAYAGGRKAFTTLALAQAAQASLPANTVVEVTNDGANNGTYQWNGTVLTKSAYDPLAQSKNYTDLSVNTRNIKQLYSTANNVLNLNVDPANGSLRTVAFAQVNVFPITLGKKYTLRSVGFDTTYAKLAVSPSNSTTVGKTQTLVTLENGGDVDTKTFTSPISGYAFLNVKWVPSLDMTTTISIKSSEFVESVGFQDKPIRDTLAQQRLDDAKIEKVINSDDLNIVDPNIYNVSVKTPLFFVGISGTLVSNSGGELISFPIMSNKTYFIKSSQWLSTKTVGLSETGTVSNGKAITNRALSATTDPSVWKLTTTSMDIGFLYAFFTTRLDSQSYDVRGSVEIYVENIPIDKSPFISKIKGIRLGINSELPPQKTVTRLSNKKVWTLGDSITQGTNGQYQPQMEQLFGTTINNYGSSGGRASRVVDIVVAGDGQPKRDVATSGTVWETKDFTNLACVTLMIGTNDSDAGIGTMGDISQIPSSKVQDYVISNDYWALFPNNYLCNIALTIEYIKWKAPQVEIHICTPPYRNQTGVSDETRITKLIPLLESVCRLYGVHLFHGTYECGIGYKHMSAEYGIYSPDGVHFTQLGNEIFGKYFAQKVLSFG